MTTPTIEARVQREEDDPHAWATAASNYLQAYSVMQTAMSDGINVQGAISGLLGAKDALRSLAASATQVPQVTCPRGSTPEANAAIDSELNAYGWPTNPKNAARAGWEACRKFMFYDQDELDKAAERGRALARGLKVE